VSVWRCTALDALYSIAPRRCTDSLEPYRGPQRRAGFRYSGVIRRAFCNESIPPSTQVPRAALHLTRKPRVKDGSWRTNVLPAPVQHEHGMGDGVMICSYFVSSLGVSCGALRADPPQERVQHWNSLFDRARRTLLWAADQPTQRREISQGWYIRQ
jgi:hypothetical protein